MGKVYCKFCEHCAEIQGEHICQGNVIESGPAESYYEPARKVASHVAILCSVKNKDWDCKDFSPIQTLRGAPQPACL